LSFASTVTEAKEIINDNPPDMIVTDYRLPDGKGSELIVERPGMKPVPVVMMTAYGDEQLAVSSLKAGAVDYIVKSETSLSNMPYIVKNIWLEWNAIITQKRMNDALLASESRYHKIFNSANDAIQIHKVSDLGVPGTFIEVNDSTCKMLRYSREELLSMGPLDIVTGYHSKPINVIFNELVQNGHSRFRTEHMRKDGVIIPVEVNAHVISIQDETVVLSVIRDITEQKNAEKELEGSIEKYRSLTDNANEGIFVIQDGNIPYANKKALEMINYKADSLAKINFLDHVHPDDRLEAAERHRERLSGEPIDSVAVFRIIDGNKQIHWIEVNAVLIEWEGCPATLNFVTDITESKTAEQALRDSEEKYRSVIENMQDVFYRADMDGILTMASPSFTKIFGFESADEYIGQALAETLYRYPEFRKDFLQILDKNGSVENFEVEMKRKDGSIVTISTSSHYVHDKTGARVGVEGILKDITLRKRTELALIESLREKEVLLKEIHHRVKNNLQIVSGLMYLQSKSVEDKEIRNILSACRNRISSMALLHENLYQISDLASVSMSPYINNLIDALLDSYGVEGRIVFNVDVADDVNLDIDTGIAMGIIVTELVTNAIKYAYSQEESGTITVVLQHSNNGIVLKIIDYGAGLPEGKDLTSDGKGLGMRLVNNLVRQIHGTITVTSAQGTAVEIFTNTGIVKIIKK
jgi:PAS domain S-box-containing protein